MAKKKELKKEEEKRKKELKSSIEFEQSTKSTIITLVIVVVVFVLFYFLTDFILEKSRKLNYKEPKKEEAVIQYKELLYSQVFKQLGEYYVLFYDFKGEDAPYYNEIVKDETKKIYTVDLGNAFNKAIVSETTNKNAQRYLDLKVKDATLIKINNGKNVFYFEGSLLYIKENIK